MEITKKWIQEMIDNHAWGLTENKWHAINVLAGLLDGAIMHNHSKELEKKILLIEREKKALVEEGETKCNEIAKLKKEIDKACDLLNDYNKAFRNICTMHPRVKKKEWLERIKGNE